VRYAAGRGGLRRWERAHRHHARLPLDGVPNDQAVAFVREHYHPHAVETPWQRRFVRRFR